MESFGVQSPVALMTAFIKHISLLLWFGTYAAKSPAFTSHIPECLIGELEILEELSILKFLISVGARDYEKISVLFRRYMEPS